MSNKNELYKQNKYRFNEKLYISYSNDSINNINFEYELNFVKYNYNFIGNFSNNNLDEKLNTEIVNYFNFNSNYLTLDNKFIKTMELNPDLIIKNINKDNYDIYFSNIGDLYNTINCDNFDINIYPNFIYLLIKIKEFDKCLIFTLNKNTNLDVKDIIINQLKFNNDCKDILIDELINNSGQMDYYNSESSRFNIYTYMINDELLKYSEKYKLSNKNKKNGIFKYFIDNLWFYESLFFRYEKEFYKIKNYIYCEYKNNNLDNIISKIEKHIK